jgi:hypothetical protein
MQGINIKTKMCRHQEHDFALVLSVTLTVHAARDGVLRCAKQFVSILRKACDTSQLVEGLTYCLVSLQVACAASQPHLPIYIKFQNFSSLIPSFISFYEQETSINKITQTRHSKTI